jgi:hydrogenase expression/formation protein HypD
MPIKHIEEYRDPDISKALIEAINEKSNGHIRLMEVCGTHTVSIFRNGIRSVLPDTISLLSGPGCPVCVTSQNEIDAFIELSKINNVIIATFGDLMRIPGTVSSLQIEHANGRDIRIVYSSMDALDLAKQNPDKKVVFLGVGFETTAPTIGASIYTAQEMGIMNYYVFSAHKLAPPALFALLEKKEVKIDGFILPGHVSVIIGSNAYIPFVEQFHIPCVVAGFESADILQAISLLVDQIKSDISKVENAYPRAVNSNGNVKALSLMETVFEIEDASWRGLGVIPESGLKIRNNFSEHDAQRVFDIKLPASIEPKGCACGEILTGIKTPPECPLYKKACTPMDPVGPCMVSSEGSCAAYFKYHLSPAFSPHKK